jgi:hypothetical protein
LGLPGHELGLRCHKPSAFLNALTQNLGLVDGQGALIHEFRGIVMGRDVTPIERDNSLGAKPARASAMSPQGFNSALPANVRC